MVTYRQRLTIANARWPTIKEYCRKTNEGTSMNTPLTSINQEHYSLPDHVDRHIQAYSDELERFLSGTTSDDEFKPLRVINGIYEQRVDGTYMTRVRISAGMITIAQLKLVAALAEEFGNGRVHLTTRQDAQLHDVRLQDTPEIMRRLKTVGLATIGGGGNSARNVVAPASSGLSPADVFDVTPFAHAVTEFMVDKHDEFDLPRKYKIAFAGSPIHLVMLKTNDLGFLAKTREGKLGFKVFAGGGMGAKSRIGDELIDWIPASECVRVAEAVRRLFERHGDRENRNRARLRFVFDRLGVEKVRAMFERELRSVNESGIPAVEVDVEVNEHPAEAPLLKWHADNGTPAIPYWRQKQAGRVAVALRPRNGLISSTDLVKLAEITERFSERGDMRTTRDQELLLAHVPTDRLGDLWETLRRMSLTRLCERQSVSIVSCTGPETCRLGLCASRPLAEACSSALAELNPSLDVNDDIEIKISGCPNACGRHPASQIGFSGVVRRHNGCSVPSYKAYIGAALEPESQTSLSEDVGVIPAKRVPGCVVAFVSDYRENKGDDETFPIYAARLGVDHFKALASPFTNPLDCETSPDGCVDWGNETAFTGERIDKVSQCGTPNPKSPNRPGGKSDSGKG